MSKKVDYKTEDLAIQETLSMTPSERLQLLAALIVDKVEEDKNNSKALWKKIEAHGA